MKKEDTKKKTGRKPLYDYKSEEFLSRIEEYAKKGFADKEIAFELDLDPTTFSKRKSEFDQLSQALSRGRARVNSIVRQRYLALGLGGIKTKRVTKQKSKFPDDFDDKIVFEEETELPPNATVLANWLFNHDEEWRKKVIDGKRLDLTSNGDKIDNSPVLFLSADALTEEQIQEYIKKNIEGDSEDEIE